MKTTCLLVLLTLWSVTALMGQQSENGATYFRFDGANLSPCEEAEIRALLDETNEGFYITTSVSEEDGMDSYNKMPLNAVSTVFNTGLAQDQFKLGTNKVIVVQNIHVGCFYVKDGKKYTFIQEQLASILGRYDESARMADPIATSTKPKITAYPNPNNGRFKINWTGETGAAQVLLINQSGIVVHSEHVGDVQDFEVKTTNKLPVGLYVLKIVGPKTTTQSTLLIN